MERHRLGGFCIVAIGLMMAVASAQGAMLSGSAAGMPSTTADLTAAGDVDWAYWTTRDSPADGSPANRKSGGTAISDISPASGTTVRGSTQTLAAMRFEYTDGMSPASGNNQPTTGLFNGTLDQTGVGVQFSVDLPAVQAYNVSVWVSGYFAGGLFTASLPGAADFTHATYVYGSSKGSNAVNRFDLLVTPDAPGDDLTISQVMNVDDGSNAHVIINAAAISVVPEPASLLLLSISGLAIVRRRRA